MPGGREHLGELAAAALVLRERRPRRTTGTPRRARRTWRSGTRTSASSSPLVRARNGLGRCWHSRPASANRTRIETDGHPGACGRMAFAWSSLLLVVPWPGCSARSRAPASSRGPRAATSCRGIGQPRCVERRPAARLALRRCSCSCSTSPRARSRPGSALDRRAAGCVRPRHRGGRRPHVPAVPQGRQGCRRGRRDARRAVPVIVVGLAVVWVVVARVFKKASLASLLMTVLFPIAAAIAGYDLVGGRGAGRARGARHRAACREHPAAHPSRRDESRTRLPEAVCCSHVRKAVIPAAGLGTRFLPATKSVPKEMLPVVDRPAIQYVVEEAVGAGLTDILIVTGRSSVQSKTTSTATSSSRLPRARRRSTSC